MLTTPCQSLEDVFAQFEGLAARQFEDSEVDRLKFMIELLKTRIREHEYSAAKVREMIHKQPSQERTNNV